MKRELAKTYEPQAVESETYDLWEKSGFFSPDNLPKTGKIKRKKPFTIIMPPPNANGALHMGHALFVTIQDVMTRFRRMQGYKTLWLPGADHAGIETQVVYDKKLEKEGKKRSDFTREELYAHILEFTQANKVIMENQLRKLGASCDWSREKFTLEPEIADKVLDTFVAMAKDGLIYRGNRIANWCVKHQTALSDLEVEHQTRTDPLYYLKYGPFTLATVRPETKFGDTAVAVNPKDPRYRSHIGKEIEIETLLGKAKIKVIADEAVDPLFGTGVVKVTPAHDPADFEMGLRHKLEMRAVIDRFGKLNEKTGPYQGMKVMEARAKVADDLKARGLLEKIDLAYTHNVAVCYKCKNTIEPLIIPQWYGKMAEPPQKGEKSLKELALGAVKLKKVAFIPDRFEKIFKHWMGNIKDWPLSRQIVWGIRIPAWFCECPENTQKIEISKTQPKKPCRKCKGRWTQDPDVLDTWFSSGQWPFLALGFPRGKDFKTFYPTSVMETGWDILFFWVARMIMLGIYRTGKPPFKTVYLHGLVRDKDRQKMSKSKGNVIDPLGVAETYGADAVRMALVAGNTAGNDPVISEDKVRGYRNFANKVWNISRFVLMHAGEAPPEPQKIRFTPGDKKLLKEAEMMAKEVTKNLEAYKFHLAAEILYHYLWHTFADKILESAKPRLKGENARDKESAIAMLFSILETSLALLHPFMPYVTETIWQKLPKRKDLLMVEPWPVK